MSTTTSLASLLAQLRARKIVLSLAEDGKLRVSAPEGATTPELVEQLRARKDEIVAALEAARDGGRPAPRPRDADGEVLSAMQRSLWLTYKLDPSSSAYAMPVALELTGPLDAALLVRCLEILHGRHESLRTTFVDREGRPRQIASAGAPFHAPIVDVQPSEVQAQIDAEVDRVFVLEEGPLFVARILRVSESRHVLLMNFHHIVFDGPSFGVLMRELSALYASGAEAKALPELPFQYADYSRWLEERLANGSLDASKRYWLDHLRGSPALLQFPTDHPRPSNLSSRGGKARLRVSREVTDGLRRISQDHGTTLFATVLAAFDVLLYRYSGQTDIVVGTPIANRTSSELEALIGYFVNPLPLRTQLAGESSFSELLAQVRDCVHRGLEHQSYPFEKIVEGLRPARSLSYSPVFQVMLNFQAAEDRAASLGGVVVRDLPVRSQTAKFDLSLAVQDAPVGLTGVFDCSAELFTQGTMDRLAENFATLLEGIVASPDSPIDALPILGPDERRRMAAVAGSAPPRLDGQGGEKTVHALFERQARATPDAVALVFGPETFTYAELDVRATAFARRLADWGVRPGDLVGLCLARSPRLVESLIGIWKAGAAYVPLDPAYPTDRLAAVARDARLSYVVAEAASPASIWADTAGVLYADGSRATTPPPAAARRDGPAESAGLSHVIYTSGSTGRPKGVMIAHRSVLALLAWARATYSPDEVSRVLFSTSICFDLSVFELWAPLTRGGAVVLVENALALCDDRTIDVTLVNTVPSALHVLLENRAIPRGASVLNVAGEPLLKDLVNAAFRVPSVKKVFNLYGPTEDTTYSTFVALTGPVTRDPTIGRPLPGTQAHVLGPGRAPLPLGAVGELYLGGAGLALGYLDRPDLTAERFVEDPLSDDPSSRLYRTGDLVRLREDGELEFFGRADNQVKIRGFRVELGEVEAVLHEAEQVKDCAVVAHPHDVDGKRMVAYVVLREGAATDGEGASAALRRHLRQTLPDYMIPAAFVVTAALPVTPNGKVDRRALLASKPELAAVEDDRPPETETEERLCRMWSEAIKVERVGVDRDFFALGGSSLVAMHLVSKVNRELQTDLRVRDIYETKTIRELAARIDRSERVQQVPVEKAPAGARHALSFPQVAGWMLVHMPGFETAFNMVSTFAIRGPLDVQALSRSLQALVDRHDSLRARFSVEGQDVTFTVVDGLVLDVPVLDLAGLPRADADRRVDGVVADVAKTPFDLLTGPVIRATIVRRAADEHVLVIAIHHMVSDGWSNDVIKRDLGRLYAAYAAGEVPALPPVAASYADYALWNRRWHETDACKKQSAFWRGELEFFRRERPFPVDTGPAVTPHPRIRYRHFKVSGRALDDISAFSVRMAMTPYAICMAAVHLCLRRHAGLSEAVVYSPVAGRSRPEFADSVGLYVNMIGVFSEMDAAMTFEEHARRIQRSVTDAQANSDVSVFTAMQGLDFTPAPFPFVLLNYFDLAHSETLRIPGLEVEHSGPSSEENPGLTAFYFVVTRHDRELEIVLGYNTAMFAEATAERIGRSCVDILADLVTHPEKTLSEALASG